MNVSSRSTTPGSCRCLNSGPASLVGLWNVGSWSLCLTDTWPARPSGRLRLFCPRLSSDTTSVVKPARSPSQLPALRRLSLLLSALPWPPGRSVVSGHRCTISVHSASSHGFGLLAPLGRGPRLVRIAHTVAGTQGSMRFAGR